MLLTREERRAESLAVIMMREGIEQFFFDGGFLPKYSFRPWGIIHRRDLFTGEGRIRIPHLQETFGLILPNLDKKAIILGLGPFPDLFDT